MKTRILYLLGMLMIVSMMEAKTTQTQHRGWGSNDEKAISFNERGIKFFIFLDGEMDFDIHANESTTTEYYYRSSRNQARIRRGTKVVRDYMGRVIRVGRVFINYNYQGKVSRVGGVFINYKHRRMSQVGGLKIYYDRFGRVIYTGSVKHRYDTGYYANYYNHYYDDDVYDYNDDFFNTNFFANYEQFQEDGNYYYYRSKGTVSQKNKGRRRVQKVIKRKKDKNRKSHIVKGLES